MSLPRLTAYEPSQGPSKALDCRRVGLPLREVSDALRRAACASERGDALRWSMRRCYGDDCRAMDQ